MRARVFDEFLRGVVLAAEHQQTGAIKTLPACQHALLKRRRGGGCRRLAGRAKVAPQAFERVSGHPAAEKLAPEIRLLQPLPVVMLDMHLRQAGGRPYPRVEQAQAAHPRIGPLGQVDQRGRRRVAQAPQHDGAHLGLGQHQRIDGRADVGRDLLEIAQGAAAVAHAAVIKAQHRVADGGQCPGLLYKKPVAARAVLRAAHHHHHAHRCAAQMQQTQQLLVLAFEHQGLFGGRRALAHVLPWAAASRESGVAALGAPAS